VHYTSPRYSVGYPNRPIGLRQLRLGLIPLRPERLCHLYVTDTARRCVATHTGVQKQRGWQLDTTRTGAWAGGGVGGVG
jgi:hypothetical protein